MSTFNDEIEKTILEAQKNIPVDIISLCKDLGLRVFRVQNWTQAMSGMIRKDAEGETFSIYVNATHSNTRQRFTIAHELAHWILHRELIGDGVLDDGLYRSGLPVQIEVEANRFGGDLLMPKSLVNREWQKQDNDIVSMATLFDVSKAAMAIRLGVPLEAA